MGNCRYLCFIHPLTTSPFIAPHSLLTRSRRANPPTIWPRIRRNQMSTSSTPPPAKTAVVPRPSASLVVVNERNEILLVHRNPKARSFGGMTVFPGGNYDKKQDSSLAITAIRETFEESGLLLASADNSSLITVGDELLDEARHKIHQQKLLFQEFLDSNHLKADTNALLPFTQWITPPGPPRRFQTQFFVAFLPVAPSTGFKFGTRQERIPKPDGGQEVISARFVHPNEALREFREGKITFMPPQFYILTTLCDILRGTRNTEEQQKKLVCLSQGAFGRMVVNPRPSKPQEEDLAQGYSILTYEGDETRGGSKGRLHRAKLRVVDGAIRELILQRNFDIFNEIEEHAFQIPPKL